jgi:hypothetical protein
VWLARRKGLHRTAQGGIRTHSLTDQEMKAYASDGADTGTGSYSYFSFYSMWGWLCSLDWKWPWSGQRSRYLRFWLKKRIKIIIFCVSRLRWSGRLFIIWSLWVIIIFMWVPTQQRDPQPRGSVYRFSSDPYPLTCLALVTLPEAQAAACMPLTVVTGCANLLTTIKWQSIEERWISQMWGAATDESPVHEVEDDY